MSRQERRQRRQTWRHCRKAGLLSGVVSSLPLLLWGCGSSDGDLEGASASDVQFTADIAPVFSAGDFLGPHASVETALCFSGGGARAMTVTMGVLRALHHLKLMDGVDAISAVSGGAWGSGLYMFSPLPLDELLGPAAPPESLTLDKLDGQVPRLGTALQAEHGTVLRRTMLTTATLGTG